MRYCLAIVFVVMLYTSAGAQQKKSWYVLPQAGLLNGDGAVSGQVMLSGGMVYKGWDFGLGIGVDYYQIRTVPLIADTRKNIGMLPLFVYADFGYNFAAPLQKQYMYADNSWWYSKSSFHNGWYAESGLGYDVPSKKNNRFVLSVGYSIKTAGEAYTETIPRDFPPYFGETNVHSFDYRFNRFVFKLGFRL